MTVAPVVAGSVSYNIEAERTEDEGHVKFREYFVPDDLRVVLNENPGELTVPCGECRWRTKYVGCSVCLTCKGTGHITRVYVAEEHKASYIRENGRWVIYKPQHQAINWMATEVKTSVCADGTLELCLSGFQPIDPPITGCRIFTDEHEEYQGGAHPCCKCRDCGGMYDIISVPSGIVSHLDIL